MKRLKKRFFYPLFAVLCVAFGAYYVYLSMQALDTPPEITAPEGEFSLSVSEVTPEKLLQGVSAQDKEDGDLTDRLILEAISNFYDAGKCRVTYAVVDSANNVTKKMRDLTLNDYAAPQITLTAPLIFSSSSKFLPSDYARAYDCIDGDLTASIKMTLPDATVSVYAPGVWTVVFRVTNSMGGSGSVAVDVTVLDPETYKKWKNAPQIQLSSYLVYAEKGTAFDAAAYINGVQLSKDEELPAAAARERITAEELPDMYTDGTYTVTYRYEDEAGRTGTTQLVVVVGEGA